MLILAFPVFQMMGKGVVMGKNVHAGHVTFRENASMSSSPDSVRVPLFESEDVLEFTIKADLSSVFGDTSDDRPYQPASLTYLESTGDTAHQDIKIKTRGEYRRLRLSCNVPPIRLNFDKSQVENTLFSQQDKIKLVTHCRDRKRSYEQYVLEEYLVYKMYNILTDTSFQVQLAQVTYEDITGKRDPVTRYGFLIEAEELLAARLGERILETGHVHPEDTDHELITMLSVFQYMIGNTDWSVQSYHNIRIIFVDPQRPPLAVPYDFDMAGIVDAEYASPNPNLRIESVRDRLFRGYCRSDEEFSAVFDRFNEKKEAIYALWRDFEPLEKRYKERALSYLDSFYTTISNTRLIRRGFLRMCLER